MKMSPRQLLAESFLNGTENTEAIRLHRGNIIAPIIVERLNRAYGLNPDADDFNPMFSIGAPSYVGDRMGRGYSIEYKLFVDISDGIEPLLGNLGIPAEEAKLIDEMSIRFSAHDPINLDILNCRMTVKDDSIEETITGDTNDSSTNIGKIHSQIQYAVINLGKKLMSKKGE